MVVSSAPGSQEVPEYLQYLESVVTRQYGTHARFARECGFDAATWAKVRRQQRNPPPAMLEQLNLRHPKAVELYYREKRQQVRRGEAGQDDAQQGDAA